MTMDKSSEKKFDKVLERALQQHSEPVPADFTDRILRQLKEAREQKILARVILEERLALAACIILATIITVVLFVFPDIIASLHKQMPAFAERIARIIIGTVNSNWQLCVIFAAIVGFAVYSFIDLLVGDN